MIIGTKCKIDENQIKARKEMGSSYIEIYTDVNFFKEDRNIKNDLELLNDYGITAYAFHAPMFDKGKNQIGLGSLDLKKRKEYMVYFKKCVQYTHEICQVKNPVVIFHPGGYYEYKPEEEKWRVKTGITKMKEELHYLDSYTRFNYPSVILTVENMPAYNLEKNKLFAYDYGSDKFAYDYGSDIKSLTSILGELKSLKINITLDICHALSVCNKYREEKGRDLEIEAFIKEYAKYLKLVHLNNVSGFGETKENHGLPYKETEEDMMLLQRIFNALHNINYNGFITVEVIDDNYNNPENMITTVKTLKTLGVV
jgi:sugar phosphate isomerase/epimerase